jgi:hypothetical protein
MGKGSRSSTVARGVAVTAALVGAVALGTAAGSADGPYNDWGCPKERIGFSFYEPSEGEGYDSPQGTLLALARFLAADGARTEAEYANAIASPTGPDRFEPTTGTLYMDDRIEARIALAQLADGTWTVDNETLCGRPVPPALASPDPTPEVDP